MLHTNIVRVFILSQLINLTRPISSRCDTSVCDRAVSFLYSHHIINLHLITRFSSSFVSMCKSTVKQLLTEV